MTFIDHVVITPTDAAQAIGVYQAICGGESIVHDTEDGSARFTRFFLGESMVEIGEPIDDPQTGVGANLKRRRDRHGPGIHLVCIPSADPEKVAAQLEECGVRILRAPPHLYVHPESANGVLVQLTPRLEFGARPAAGDARVDHVAIATHDLGRCASTWSQITGVAEHRIGVHPASNGAFEASRFAFAGQMIELLSPIDGIPSPLAKRLADRGEKLSALALPANDLETTLTRVRAAGARVLHQHPHWLVHPADAGGVMVQLTPRISH